MDFNGYWQRHLDAKSDMDKFNELCDFFETRRRATGKIATNRKEQRGIHDNSVAVGMRAFFAIAEKVEPILTRRWPCLGIQADPTYYNWKSGNVSGVARSF